MRVIEFVGPPGEKPKYAIAVIVENQGPDETGGGVAGPIANAVLTQALQGDAG